jgi:hypothetical protein
MTISSPSFGKFRQVDVAAWVDGGAAGILSGGDDRGSSTELWFLSWS